MPDTYTALQTAASKLLETLHTAEPQRVAGYHKLGGLIDDYLQEAAAAQPMEQILKRLGADLGISDRLLYDIIRFRRTYPEKPNGHLGWKQHVELLKIEDENLRTQLLQSAQEENWSVRELRGQITLRLKANAAAIDVGAQNLAPDSEVSQHFSPLRGIPYSYKARQKPEGNGFELDLGFGDYMDIAGNKLLDSRGLNIGLATYTSKPIGQRYQLSSIEHPNTRYYSYKATVIDVVDGDTLNLVIDLGFRIRVRHRVRLRGINTPEIFSAAGIAAKQYVEAKFKNNPKIAITTTKADKYGRYLADIFYLEKAAPPQVVMDSGIFLNAELLQLGLAKPY